jgi:hypothetical protein
MDDDDAPAAAATADWDQVGAYFVPTVTNVAPSFDAVGSASASAADNEEGTGCVLYSFVVSTVLIGSLCILGVAGNTAAFLVFQRDKLKTSTTFLFQVKFCDFCQKFGQRHSSML